MPNGRALGRASPVYPEDAPAGGGRRVTGYSNTEFDGLVAKGDSAKSVDEAITFYQQAEDLVLKDLPVIPMWFGKTSVLRGENIDIVYNRVNELEWETATIGS